MKDKTIEFQVSWYNPFVWLLFLIWALFIATLFCLAILIGVYEAVIACVLGFKIWMCTKIRLRK